MRPYYKKVIFLAVFSVALMSVFIWGQIFYYNRAAAATTRNTSAVPKGKPTKNLNDSLQQKIVFTYQENDITVNREESKNWIEGYARDYSGEKELRINAGKLTSYLEKISKEIDVQPQNARLIIINGRVSEFEPPKLGKTVDIPATINRFSAILVQGNYKSGGSEEIRIELVIEERQPEITLDKINDLGINKLLARGESNFGGSPKFRIHNINAGAKKISGILIKPGEEFSFNSFLGPVDASTGYLPELVIKKGAVTPEYGGGLCQVSTTLFRAAVLAGLPILERHPHSIPVHYYNPQGFDATIYPGVSDLRFKNDTPAYILIQPEINGSQINFQIYGTDDGRKVILDGPNQYDIKPNGSLKTTLNRTIVYPDGGEKKDIFQSSYSAPGSFPVVRNPLE